ncbi:9620_t:CDS:1, partial [Dentiscutata erythropus]
SSAENSFNDTYGVLVVIDKSELKPTLRCSLSREQHQKAKNILYFIAQQQ